MSTSKLIPPKRGQLLFRLEREYTLYIFFDRKDNKVLLHDCGKIGTIEKYDELNDWDSLKKVNGYDGCDIKEFYISNSDIIGMRDSEDGGIKYWNAIMYMKDSSIRPHKSAGIIYGIKKSVTPSTQEEAKATEATHIDIGGSRKRRKSICKNYNKKCKHYTKKYKLKHKIKHKNTNRQKYQKRK